MPLYKNNGTLIDQDSLGPGVNTWGSVTGTLSDQIDLNTALNAKQATLTRNTGLISTVTHASSVTALAFGTYSTVKITPNSTRTFTTTVPAMGVEGFLIILTSGTTSYTLTFGTGFKTTGTLATGTVTAKIFIVHFISDGTNMIEVKRSTAI
jgi:hypothetical protein